MKGIYCWVLMMVMVAGRCAAAPIASADDIHTKILSDFKTAVAGLVEEKNRQAVCPNDPKIFDPMELSGKWVIECRKKDGSLAWTIDNDELKELKPTGFYIAQAGPGTFGFIAILRVGDVPPNGDLWKSPTTILASQAEAILRDLNNAAKLKRVAQNFNPPIANFQ